MTATLSAKTTAARFRVSLPVLLALFPLAIVIPLVGFSVFSLSQFATSLRSVAETRVLEQANSVSANIDREINGLISTAGALSTSRNLLDGNYQGFYAQAKVAMDYAKANVLLLESSGQQLVNTRVPYGTALPSGSAPAGTREIFKDKRANVSGIFIGQVAGAMVFNVAVPVIIEEKVRYVLVVTSEPPRIKAVLDQQLLPRGWHIDVNDRTGQLIASTDGDAQRPALPVGEHDTSTSNAELIINTLIQDQPSTLAYRRSALTGWTTSVWTPYAVLDAPLSQTWRNLYSSSLLAIGLSALFAYFFSIPLASLIRKTLDAAGELGKRTPLPPIDTFLKEGLAIESTLSAADAELRERRRLAEEGKALLDTLLENVPEGITIVGGPEMRVIANSKKALEWIGRPEDQLRVLAGEHATAYGMWFPGGETQPAAEQLPLYRASRLGEAVTEEYFTIKRPDGSEIAIEANVNPIRTVGGQIIGAVSCWRDVSQRLAAQKMTEANERRLTLAVELGGVAILDMDLERKVLMGLINGQAVMGFDFEAGETVGIVIARLLAAVHPDDRQKVEKYKRLAITQTGTFSDEFRLVRADGSIAWIEVRGETLANARGMPARFFGINVDITERKRSEEHLRLVLRELTHRAKNLLAIIGAIATQTASRNVRLEDFLQAFSRRVQGLGASHDLLVKTNWGGVPLADLVFSQLAPFGGVDGDRIQATGPLVVLKPEALQSLGLALNELATNAMKYGSLSVDAGTIVINWAIDGSGQDARFRMSWSEHGGPPVKRPRRKGFGHVIIESSLAQVLKGEAHIEFVRTGIVWSVDAPLSAVTPAT